MFLKNRQLFFLFYPFACSKITLIAAFAGYRQPTYGCGIAGAENLPVRYLLYYAATIQRDIPDKDFYKLS